MDIPTACVLSIVWLATAYVACKRDNPLAFVAALLATGALLKV
jgi:hypothetical protein